MFIDAGVHAREWISVSVSVYMIERMVSEYETNDQIKWLLDNFDWWIVSSPDLLGLGKQTCSLFEQGSRSSGESKMNFLDDFTPSDPISPGLLD